jgi:hypothetical protein
MTPGRQYTACRRAGVPMGRTDIFKLWLQAVQGFRRTRARLPQAGPGGRVALFVAGCDLSQGNDHPHARGHLVALPRPVTTLRPLHSAHGRPCHTTDRGSSAATNYAHGRLTLAPGDHTRNYISLTDAIADRVNVPLMCPILLSSVQG